MEKFSPQGHSLLAHALARALSFDLTFCLGCLRLESVDLLERIPRISRLLLSGDSSLAKTLIEGEGGEAAPGDVRDGGEITFEHFRAFVAIGMLKWSDSDFSTFVVLKDLSPVDVAAGAAGGAVTRDSSADVQASSPVQRPRSNVAAKRRRSSVRSTVAAQRRRSSVNAHAVGSSGDDSDLDGNDGKRPGATLAVREHM